MRLHPFGECHEGHIPKCPKENFQLCSEGADLPGKKGTGGQVRLWKESHKL